MAIVVRGVARCPSPICYSGGRNPSAWTRSEDEVLHGRGNSNGDRHGLLGVTGPGRPSFRLRIARGPSPEKVATTHYHYPGATAEDLEETKQLLRKTGAEFRLHRGDVRRRAALVAAVADGLAAFGGIDIVLPTAPQFDRTQQGRGR